MQRTTEDYLKTIYLLGRGTSGVRGVTIAEELGVSRPTVCIIVRRLEEDGYVTKNAEHEIFLTEQGYEIAKSTLDRHQTLETLLVELGVDQKTAAEDACKMEHGVSRESFQALKRLTEREDGT